MNHRIATTILLAALIAGRQLAAQESPRTTPEQHASIIFHDDRPKMPVLLLGVFHFAGEQVDANTTPLDLRVDMLSAARQKQIAQLVRKLAQFKPTKIVVESPPQRQMALDSAYAAYRAGRLSDSRWLQTSDEQVQLAFRLASMLSHDRVYAANAPPFTFSLNARDSVLTYEKYKDQPIPAAEEWDHVYDALSAYADTLKARLPLNEYLAYLNAPRVQARSIGRWLVATKRGSNDEPVGADGFITRYFNRNVRIYSNVQRIATSPDDRILVIYGATHMYMLKQLFGASPEFTLKDIQPYLK
jgi:hypothetical protein